MSIIDIIWPWGALSRARKEFAAAERTLNWSCERAEQLRDDLEVAYRRNRNLEERNVSLSRAATHYRNVLAHSHYRDPKTGRIGKRGQYPGAEQ